MYQISNDTGTAIVGLDKKVKGPRVVKDEESKPKTNTTNSMICHIKCLQRDKYDNLFLIS